MKKYLSYTQLDLWNKSKAQYIKKYFELQTPFETKEMRFGKSFALALENRDIEHATYLDNSEVRVEANINGVLCMGYLDASTNDFSKVLEYKTGKTEWTQERAESHKQIDFYSAMIYENYGVIPEFTIEWHETIDDSDGSIVATGRVEKFVVEKTLEDIVKMSEEIKRVYKEIENAYESWTKTKDMDVDLGSLYEYIELSKQIDEMTKRQDEIKKSIKLPDSGVKIEGAGTFYYTTKKKYEEAPKHITEAVQKAKENMDQWILDNLPKEYSDELEKSNDAMEKWTKTAKVIEEKKIVNYRK